MSLDTTALGVAAASLMDDLAADCADEMAEVGVVAIVVEIRGQDDDGTRWTRVDYRCTDHRKWVQAGLLAEAGRTVRDGEAFNQ